ncbi:ubinuclein-1-like [Bidens hawaiensis]|uniref:ubinuclein-1-like n=1 Tax=Bidens hawaiensis TaxID=980011 RepID=UPI0040495BC3
MVDMGVSANEEKAGKLKQLKREVDEMVKMRAPLMKLEAVEQQAGSSDDFQEPSTKEKVVRCTYKTDDVLEDKLCDLYDCFVDGLDEDAGPQVRKLYAELAELFPKGCMDNHGIKRAICRAKDRRKALYGHKDQEKMKRKKIVPTKTETVIIDTAGSTGQVQHTPDKLDSSAPVKPMPSTMATAAITTARPLGPTTDMPKQEKPKSSVNIQSTTVSEAVKKISKKKPEAKLHDCQSQLPEKSNLAQAKQMVVKAAAQPPPPPPPAASAPDGQPKVVRSSVDMV